jgi:ABC-type sulfate/molybdate transport systems ATPase subunit
VRRYKRARLTGLQKRYYAKLYRIGKLKKKPYSQVWKYKNDIRKMEKLQQQYLFLVRHDVHGMEELASTVLNLTDKRKESSAEKSRVFRAKQRCKSLFDIADQMDELQTAEISFQNGDNFFLEEHNQWTELEKKLMAEGYTYEEIKNLREYYKEQIAYVSGKERASVKELNLGKSIWKDMVSDDTEIIEEKDKSHEKTQDRIITKQPKR